MSGGVDSSTAAYLLLKEGYEVIGLTMKLWEGKEGRCCSVNSIEDAKWVAQKLSIPFYVLNLKEEFEKEVIEYFCNEYTNGRTPNPCIVCNEKVKFKVLLKKKEEFEASFIATGHYAKVKYNPVIRRYCLKKGEDLQKDQSYMLFSLSQDQLSHTIFPLGELTKEEVRSLATSVKLPVYSKTESQDICFVSQNNYNEFLKKRRPSAFKPGLIVTKEKKIIGTHSGIPLYTIGQRKGLGGGKKRPLYVIEIDKTQNIIVVGEREEAYAKSMEVAEVNWVSIPEPKTSIHCKVKVRYQHKEAEAIIVPLQEKKRCRVDFLEPQWAITPGQAAVFYEGDTVIGGGWIDKVIKNYQRS